MLLKTRIIGSRDCPKCAIMKSICEKYKISYEMYDADVQENQKQLDEWNIEEMPVIQIIDEFGKKLHQFMPGIVSINGINIMMDKINKHKIY